MKTAMDEAIERLRKTMQASVKEEPKAIIEPKGKTLYRVNRKLAKR